MTAPLVKGRERRKTGERRYKKIRRPFRGRALDSPPLIPQLTNILLLSESASI